MATCKDCDHYSALTGNCVLLLPKWIEDALSTVILSTYPRDNPPDPAHCFAFTHKETPNGNR